MLRAAAGPQMQPGVGNCCVSLSFCGSYPTKAQSTTVARRLQLIMNVMMALTMPGQDSATTGAECGLPLFPSSMGTGFRAGICARCTVPSRLWAS